MQQTVLITGTKDNFFCIDIYEVFKALGQEKPKAFLGFYIFSGCGQIWKFHEIL